MADRMADRMADSTCQGTALPLQDNALHKRARLFRRTRDALASCTRRKLRLLRLSPLQANRASRAPVPAGSVRHNGLNNDAKVVLRAACKREDGANVELQM